VKRALILGAGLAGASAAIALRKAGFDGSLVIVGDEGQLPYERPPLSKTYLRGEEPASQALVQPAQDYGDDGIELRLGRRAMTIDRRHRLVTLDDGSELRYDRLLLATGSSARRLVASNAHLPGVFHLRTMQDADSIRIAAAEARRVVVIGGGWVGSEVAASLRQMGLEVALVTNLGHPLERVLGPEVSSVYAAAHRSHGVELVHGRVRALDGDGRVSKVWLSGGRSLEADFVVAGVGASPRLELVRRSGLEVASGGVAVDERLQTSDPRILAAGDIAAAWHPRLARRLRVEHWDNAREQGATAARNLLGAAEPYARTPYFYSDQYDLSMEYRGYAEAWDQVVVRGDPESGSFVAFWLLEGRIHAALNMNEWNEGASLAALVDGRPAVSAARLADPGIELDQLAA
jgi:3-phenylpropionate/trans-cinnamate dioxygenase ferredoxin reductase subunit